MSLNHFTDNKTPNPWMNPRMNSLVVDGKATVGALELKTLTVDELKTNVLSASDASIINATISGSLKTLDPPALALARGTNCFYSLSPYTVITDIKNWTIASQSGSVTGEVGNQGCTLFPGGITIFPPSILQWTYRLSGSITFLSVLPAEYIFTIGYNGAYGPNCITSVDTIPNGGIPYRLVVPVAGMFKLAGGVPISFSIGVLCVTAPGNPILIHSWTLAMDQLDNYS